MASSFRAKFDEHLRTEHGRGRITQFLRQIVYGGNDGIVTTFAVVAGFSGAGASGAPEIGAAAVLLFGLANLFSDATAMGLGAFLSSRSEQDVYKATRDSELHEIEHNAEFERKETVEILRDRGVAPEDAEAFADLYQRNPEFMADFMMQYEIGMADPDGSDPAEEALATFVAFIAFGAIPLIPYFLLPPNETTFQYSIATTVLAMVALGLLRWRTTTETAARCVTETVAVGGVCAIVAYLVGLAFR